MNHTLLFENEKKRIDYPLSRLLCFVMFIIWQMGIIYYMGPALNINGRTPLPIDMDNVTMLMASCYILNILWMIFLPKKYVYAARTSVTIALITAVGLFLPLSPEALTLLLYIQVFCCCFIIAFETATMVLLLSEKSTILYLIVAYPIGYIAIAILQNDMIKLPFSIFRFGIVIMLIMLLYFYFKLPANNMPRFAQKTDGLVFPKTLYAGVYFMAFLLCLLAVVGPAVVAETYNGVPVAYIFAAISSILIYLSYTKKGVHPLKSVSLTIMFGAIGYVLLFLSLYIPWISYPACALIGIGIVPGAMLPFFGSVLMRQYPSRFITSIIMIFAVAAVLTTSSLLELFRDNIHLLYLSYLVIVVILAIVYLYIAPFLQSVLNEKLGSGETVSTVPDVLASLTERELEVADLISRGYSNKDIAKLLFISEYTVKDHTKNIYRKLDIHSRFELAAIVNKK